MARKISAAESAALQALQQRFSAWRGPGRNHRRIPEALWQAATELAQQLGVNPVSRSMGLDYTRLKRRLHSSNATMAPVSADATGAFVELAVANETRTRTCMIEFEGRRGKLRIQLNQHQPTEVLALAKALAFER